MCPDATTVDSATNTCITVEDMGESRTRKHRQVILVHKVSELDRIRRKRFMALVKGCATAPNNDPQSHVTRVPLPSRHHLARVLARFRRLELVKSGLQTVSPVNNEVDVPLKLPRTNANVVHSIFQSRKTCPGVFKDSDMGPWNGLEYIP